MRTYSLPMPYKTGETFGSPLIGRGYQADTLNGYRFSFSGKEKMDEIYGDGNGVEYGARINNTRLGKWFSVDKEFSKGPAFSSYCTFLNNPILLEDPDGNWVKITTTKYYKDRSGELQVKKAYNIFKETVKIEKQMTIGDVRFLDLNTDYYDHLSPLTAEQKSQVIANYKSELIAAYGGISFKEIGKPTIETSLNFVGEMKFVNSLSELKGGEELYVIGDLLQKGEDALAVDKGGSLVGINTSRALMQGTPDDDGNAFAHEFNHQRTRNLKENLYQATINTFKANPDEGGHFDHQQEGIFDNDPKNKNPTANYNNADSIKKGSKGINVNRAERKLNEKGYKDLHK